MVTIDKNSKNSSPSVARIKPETYNNKKRNSASSSSSSSSCEEARIMIERSPSFEQKRLKHKWDVQQEKYENTWKSCCGSTMDRRAVQYFTSVGIISFTMLFCVYQLITLNECGDQQAYMGLLTLLIGILIPQPKFKEKM